MKVVSAMKSNDFQGLLQNFFLKWMMSQKKVSPSTIQAYKDSFRILLKYLHEEHGVKASSINMEGINADAIIGFLHYLEHNRKNSYKTVNNRLAAIKSFMEYVSYESPEYSGTVRKIKAIPFRKVEKKEICYLTKAEIDSLLKLAKPKILKEGVIILYCYSFIIQECQNVKGLFNILW
ncbi:tyrosine-type recombinase/integrase [Halalkalibacter kiskunsagensis]|uniref:Tyrosine-type recombinase/integrase n=2 Tax=Halalkalibacter kiskunsagensis TaxID=1548599 RepID=A0ABV6KGT6_9BACI